MPNTLTKAFLVAAAAACALATPAQAAVTISTAATKNENCSGGVCTPTAKSANINVGDLQAMLATSDVTVKTGAGAVAIGVNTPLTWSNTHRLTLDSIEFVHIKAAVVIEGTGALTLTTNDGGTGGDLVIEDGGTINFWDLNSNLIVNGTPYTLVNDIDTLAAGIAANPSGSFALAANVASHKTYGTAIPTAYSGTFEGLGNTISGLTVKASMFSNIQGAVRDLVLAQATVTRGKGVLAPMNHGTILNVSADVSVSGFCAGGLVGTNAGTIRRSHVTGTVQGRLKCLSGGIAATNTGLIETSSASAAVTVPTKRSTAGGLVGQNMQGGTIAQSFATGKVSVTNSEHNTGGLGGLAGFSEGVIVDSYATGKVSGTSGTASGGLIGVGGPANTSYSTGQVLANGGHAGGLIAHEGLATNSYWDTDTSGQKRSSAGTKLTDAQLKSALPAGFDPNVWGQSASINNGWPYLLANPPQ